MAGLAKSASIIRAAQARAGYYRQTERMCKAMRIEPRTFSNRLKNSGSINLSELKRMDMVLHFTDEEIIRMVRG